MKRFVEGQDRRQLILLPDCLDDCVGEDNPVRIVDAFIDELDLAVLGFDGVVPEVTGRPAYHPSTLLKIYLYGYLNRVQSSRRLVDAEHHLIVAHEVTNQGYDRHQLAPMALKARQATGCEQVTALADRGYFSGDQVLSCEGTGVAPVVPKTLTSSGTKRGFFTRQDFIYDAVWPGNTARRPPHLPFSHSLDTKRSLLKASPGVADGEKAVIVISIAPPPGKPIY